MKQISFQIIKILSERFPLKQVLAAVGVARSTYYRWKQAPPTKKKHHLENKIYKLCRKHRFQYGYRKISALLQQTQAHSKGTVQRIMRENGWNCIVKPKKYHHKPGTAAIVAENVLNRDFTAKRPLQKLVTDVTYLPFGNKLLYLSTIMDVFNREIIAYTISDKQDTAFVLDTLNQLDQFELSLDCLLHSDQGSVYTSHEYQQAVKEKGVIMSMSRKGTPADNAIIETFHASLKCETFYVEGLLRTTNDVVVQTVQTYINYYNNTRILAKLNHLSPIMYRKKMVKKI
jgi:putative transposase